jgi:hypothetical protein
MNRNKVSLNSSLQKAAELSGAAGEFRCHRLDFGLDWTQAALKLIINQSA